MHPTTHTHFLSIYIKLLFCCFLITLLITLLLFFLITSIVLICKSIWTEMSVVK